MPHALTASTACLATTLPWGETAVVPSRRVAGVPSWMTTPRSRTTRRRPRASRAGCVASARAPAADVLLEDDDTQVGVVLVEKIGGPESGESASHDDHVGLDVLVQGRTVRARILRQRVAQPPAALLAGSQRIAGEVEVVGPRRHGASVAG